MAGYLGVLWWILERYPVGVLALESLDQRGDAVRKTERQILLQI
jgi:hypothetical protein